MISMIPVFVYVVMGIDEHEHDRILAVCRSWEDARNYLTRCMLQTDYFDMWIEKHEVTD